MEHLMKKYKQLTFELRYQIFAYKQENYSISKIVRILGFNMKTLNEISLNNLIVSVALLS
ncbi:helix-turn-helix domain-containing protein [Arcobacter sp. HD9-500m-PIT-SAG03]|nr:helix-turn-helix domain-containing protein [Arcobacter sp. HD9-500m-PIT-SAG03]